MTTLQVDVKSEISELLKAQLCRRKLSAFVQEFWEVVEPGTPLIWTWYLQVICDHLEAVTSRKIRHLIICLPPGFAKSLIVSVLWPAWEWLNHPEERTLFGSYDEKLVLRDADRCRDVIQSEKYQKLFTPSWQIDKKRNAAGYYTNSRQGSRKSYFMTSRKKTGWRGDKVVVDDPISAEDRYDDNIKAQVIETWDKVMSTRVNNPARAAFVVIMQRLADNDLAGYLMKKYGNKYVVLKLPAEFNPKKRCTTPIFTDPRTKPGELLFPQLFPKHVLDEKKIQLGPVDYAAQYDHEPHPEAGSRFQSQYFQYWKHSGQPYIITLVSRNGKERHIRVDLLAKFISCDTACTEEKASDYTSIGLWASTDRADMILLHRMYIKEQEPQVIAALKSMYEFRAFGPGPPSVVYLEANGLGKPISQNAKHNFLPVKEIDVSKDKYVLSANAKVRLEGGQIYFPDFSIAPWMPEFTENLIAFPAGEHDDDVSMISLAANSFYENHVADLRPSASIPKEKSTMAEVNKITADLGRRRFLGVK